MKQFLLRIFYESVKWVSQVAVKIFYPNTLYINKEKAQFDNPAILVSNHPNTMMDAFITGGATNRQMYFLGNASLFKTKFTNWFFSTFYTIKVERLQDTGGKPINNKAAFKQSYDHLEQGGVLYIAPEGTSFMERRLRPLKTGTFRIALELLDQRNQPQDLIVQPIGITYYQPNRFGSGMVVNVGDPFLIKDYLAQYRQDNIGTVKHLTQLLEQRLQDLTVHIPDEEIEILVSQLEPILETNKKSKKERFLNTQILANKLPTLEEETRNELSLLATQYTDQLSFKKIDDQTVAHRGQGSLFIQYFLLLLGLPAYLYGWAANALPFYLLRFAQRKANLYVGYHATLKIVGSVFLFPLFYWLQYKLIDYFVGAPYTWGYLLALIPAAIFVVQYEKLWAKMLQNSRWNRLQQEEQKDWKVLRQKLVGELAKIIK